MNFLSGDCLFRKVFENFHKQYTFERPWDIAEHFGLRCCVDFIWELIKGSFQAYFQLPLMGFSEKISRKYFEGGPCIGRHVSPYSYTPTPYLCKSVGEAGGGGEGEGGEGEGGEGEGGGGGFRGSCISLDKRDYRLRQRLKGSAKERARGSRKGLMDNVSTK